MKSEVIGQPGLGSDEGEIILPLSKMGGTHRRNETHCIITIERHLQVSSFDFQLYQSLVTPMIIVIPCRYLEYTYNLSSGSFEKILVY